MPRRRRRSSIGGRVDESLDCGECDDVVAVVAHGEDGGSDVEILAFASQIVDGPGYHSTWLHVEPDGFDCTCCRSWRSCQELSAGIVRSEWNRIEVWVCEESP